MTIHTVRQGNTLNQIAKQHASNPAAIAQLNGLQDQNNLLVGQALLIPGNTAREYIVQPGDTVWQIAQRHGITPQQLLEANRTQIANPDVLRAGQKLRLPGGRKEIIINGYCYPTIRDEMLDTALRNLSMISVFSCPVSASGELTAMKNDERVIAKAKAAGVRPIMVIANIEEGKGFQAATVQALLQSPAAQTNLLQNCVKLMKDKGYTGLDVDFEYVPAAVKEELICFLAKARAWMHDEGFILTSAIPPKTSDTQTGILVEGFDFPGEGKYNDYITLMTYEWGYQGGPPMAVSPIHEVRNAMEYAMARMPKEKILMGIPNYGYDWKIPYQAGTNATVVQNPGALTIAARHGAEINYDEKAQTPWLRYTEGGQQHEVWFEDARSIYAKLALVQELGIGGVSYWTVNQPFAQNWALLANMFRAKKA